jgi:hypothetical protein
MLEMESRFGGGHFCLVVVVVVVVVVLVLVLDGVVSTFEALYICCCITLYALRSMSFRPYRLAPVDVVTSPLLMCL